MFFGTLAFYYLASGVLVFLDRHRILRTIRLIYLIGLWAVSMAVIGIMARIHLIRMNEELLYISCAALAGTPGLSWLAYRQVDEGRAATSMEVAAATHCDTQYRSPALFTGDRAHHPLYRLSHFWHLSQ